MANLPPNIQTIFDNMTTFQRTYCEYRSKGLSQAIAAEKAGSNGKDKNALTCVGYAIEQLDGAKEYISYLQMERAKVLPVDELEIIAKLREVYSECMRLEEYREANKALELMGTIIGLFGRNKIMVKPETGADSFKDEGVENNTNERIAKLQSMMKDLNKG
jgi:hypothetical protein